MGETYGVLPTDVMKRRPRDFWLNAQIRAATEQFKADQRADAQAGAQGPGVATPAEKRDLAQRQEQRADQREDMEEAGQKTVDADDQLAALEDFQEDLERDREQSKRLQGQLPNDVDAGADDDRDASGWGPGRTGGR